MNLDSKAAVNTHLNYFYSTNTQNENTTLVIHHQFQTRYRKSHSITILLIRFGTVHENKKKRRNLIVHYHRSKLAIERLEQSLWIFFQFIFVGSSEAFFYWDHHHSANCSTSKHLPVQSRNILKKCEIGSNLTIKTPEHSQSFISL